MMDSRYETLRADLNEPATIVKGMGQVFTQMALKWDGPTASVITAAALNVPGETIADLIGWDVVEVDAVVSMFTAQLARYMSERLSGDTAA